MYILLDTACSTNVDSGACLINHIKKMPMLEGYNFGKKLIIKSIKYARGGLHNL